MAEFVFYADGFAERTRNRIFPQLIFWHGPDFPTAQKAACMTNDPLSPETTRVVIGRAITTMDEQAVKALFLDFVRLKASKYPRWIGLFAQAVLLAEGDDFRILHPAALYVIAQHRLLE